MADEFWEAYKHPLWQKKRLEILERDSFCCLDCGENEKQLHVHHSGYLRGFKPWEYPDCTFRTLCEECHQIAERKREEIKKLLLITGHEFSDEIEGYLAGLTVRNCVEIPQLYDDPANPSCLHRAVIFADSHEFIRGFAAAIRSTPEEIACLAAGGKLYRHNLDHHLDCPDHVLDRIEAYELGEID
jgi:hypothetical protein